MVKERIKEMKIPADKIVLLGFLVLSLIIARFITYKRTMISVGEAIGLNGVGLSVSMPSGKDWKVENRWRFQNNTFFLSAAMSRGAEAQCRYMLGSPIGSDEMFAKRAEYLGGNIVEQGELDCPAGKIKWVVIKSESKLLEDFLGILELGFGRQVQVEVSQFIFGDDMGRRAFLAIAGSVTYEEAASLEAGAELVGAMKAEGLVKAFEGGKREVYFIAEDKRKNKIGFTMDILSKGFASDGLNIQGVSFLFLRNNFAREQMAFFRCADDMSSYEWRSESSGVMGRGGSELNVREGKMSIRDMSGDGSERVYRLNDVSVAESLLEILLNGFIAGAKDEAMIDIVESEGTITPTVLTKIDGGKAVKLGYLNRPGVTEEIYFGDGGEIVKRVLPQEGVILNGAEMEAVLRAFPSRKEAIIRSKGMIEGEQL